MTDTHTPPPTSAEKPNPETILVMEPDVIVRMVLADYLRECGYKVVEAVSDDDVLNILNTSIDIAHVFSGAQPADGAAGFSLAHRIRIAHPGVSVILTSGIEHAAQKVAEICGDGPNGHLTKAYNPQEVVRRIQFLRERHRTSK